MPFNIFFKRNQTLVQNKNTYQMVVPPELEFSLLLNFWLKLLLLIALNFLFSFPVKV